MEIWDVKDRFWNMDCQEGEQLNFTYVLPQPPGMPVVLVIPLSLQMGWVESPPFFCATTETSCNFTTQYCETAVGFLPACKFTKYLTGDSTFELFPTMNMDGDSTSHNFMEIVIPIIMEMMLHIATATMHGTHDCFPTNNNNENDPISLKKMRKGKSQLSL